MPNELTSEVLVTLKDSRDILRSINPAIRWPELEHMIVRLNAVISRLEDQIGK